MQDTKQFLGFAGDVRVEKCSVISSTGIEYSLKSQLIGLQIFEDLYSPFITGTLIFKDSLDFVNALPFIGQETLSLKVYTPTLEKQGAMIDAQFFIHKMKDREYQNERSVIYEMNFISKEFITDVNMKLSKPYSGKVSEIVKSVLTDKNIAFNTTKKLNIEETKNSIKFISNYWSPVRIVNYATSHALNREGSPSYIFFENRDGFNFGSIDTLLSSTKIQQEFSYNSNTQNIKRGGGSVRDLNQDYKRITSISVTDGFNGMDRLRSGMLASRLYSYDITSKTVDVKNFDIFSNFKNKKHLNKYPTVSTKLPTFYTSKILILPKQTEQFTGYLDVSNIKFIQTRLSEINQINDFKITITVPGRFDYTAGQIVFLKTFQVEPITKEETLNENLDKIFSGKYIIAAINHFVSRTEHECTIELVKDSYSSDVLVTKNKGK